MSLRSWALNGWANRQGVTSPLGFLPQSKGHLCEGICSSLPVIINIQNDPHCPYQTFLDHSVDQDLKRVQGATMPSDENSFLVTLGLKIEASFLLRILLPLPEPLSVLTNQ